MLYMDKEWRNRIDVKLVDDENVLVYKFHYDHIKVKCDSKSNLLITDTNSLIYEINTDDFYEDFSSDKEMFDFNNYLTKSKY